MPIYIQRIHLQTMIKDIQAQGGQSTADLFTNFNGIQFEQLGIHLYLAYL